MNVKLAQLAKSLFHDERYGDHTRVSQHARKTLDPCLGPLSAKLDSNRWLMYSALLCWKHEAELVLECQPSTARKALVPRKQLCAAKHAKFTIGHCDHGQNLIPMDKCAELE